MNVNPRIIAAAKEAGLPAAQDIYEGKATEYVTFTYEDERAEYYADNDEGPVTATLQVQLITPQGFDYFEHKKALKKALKKQGFCVENVRTWLVDALSGVERIRQTVYTVNYTDNDG